MIGNLASESMLKMCARRPTKNSIHLLACSSTSTLKLEILINSSTKSQFNCCPLVWVFHDRVLNSKLNLIQERVLRLVCKGSEIECENLMKRTFTTHNHSLQLFMIEIYQAKHSLNPTGMKDVFAERNTQYNLRNENHLRLPVAKTTTYGLETIEYRACRFWSTLPSYFCKLCKIYVRNLGFLYLSFNIFSFEHCD